MDIFAEQLFRKKPEKTEILLRILLFAICGLTAGFMTLFLLGFMKGRFFPLSILIDAGLVYLAFYVSGRFNIEFEYCLTNGLFDIDTVINRNSRKRLASFECKDVEDFGVYDENRSYNCNAVIMAVNKDTPEKYYMIFNHKEKGKTLAVIEPNEKMLDGLKRCLPRQIVINVFGNKL